MRKRRREPNPTSIDAAAGLAGAGPTARSGTTSALKHPRAEVPGPSDRPSIAGPGAYLSSGIDRLTRRIGAAAVVVTHDISSFFRIAHRAVMLGGERDGELQGRVIMQGSPEDFKASRHKVVRRFFGLGDLETSEEGNERR